MWAGSYPLGDAALFGCLHKIIPTARVRMLVGANSKTSTSNGRTFSQLLFLLVTTQIFSVGDSFSPVTHSSFTTTKSQINTSRAMAEATEAPTGKEAVGVVDDPYVWLEDVEAEECLDFAKSANEKCLEALGDPKTSPTKTYDRVLEVLESKDRIPHTRNYGKDEDGNRILFNFWKDEEHPKGVWRKTLMDSYQTENPEWTTVLDVDALAEKDGISWVWKGSTTLPRSRDPMSDNGRIVTRALLSLSRGGSDATHIKEFDLLTGDFVTEQPFILPEAKSRVSYKSRNVLLVGTEIGGKESLTDSGYPRTLREWVRGTKLEDAPIIFEGEKTDVSVGGSIVDERKWGGKIWQLNYRSLTFYTSKYWIAQLQEEHLLAPDERPEGIDLKDPEFVEVDIQDDASFDTHGNLMFVTLRSDWTPKEGGRTYKRGSVIYCVIDTFLEKGKAGTEFIVLFEPTERTAYEYHTCTKNYLILSTMDNVKSKLEFYKLGDNGSSLTLVGADKEAQIRSCSASPIDGTDTDEFWFTTSDYITPSTLCLADASLVETGSENKEEPYVIKEVKSLPPQYDSSDLKVEQRTAISKDGTEIPYFIVMKKDIELNGKNPTLLYGYGGFEISLGPHYIATSGLAWLEKGGVYVEANIRGGGEFGPSWHQAALKEKRNKAHEDFIAVGEHLIESKICTAKTLAARGGSNGGLLMGIMYTKRPDLFGAIHCAVPLLDMKRFHILLAGASWMAEYGNPDTDDWDNYLKNFSPYQNIDESVEKYPPILFTTSTRDDRVHPAHARKMVKKLWDLGKDKDWPVYYYENIEGGHGGAADAKQSAFMTSLAYDFMFDTLTKNAEAM